jgi:hypothetical protein
MGGSLDNGFKLYPWEWLFKYNTWTLEMEHASRIYLSHKRDICRNRSNRIGSKWTDEKIWSLIRFHQRTMITQGTELV